MYCRDCVRYDFEGEKCLDGKVNPQRYEQALSVAQVMGLRAICIFNDHRERLVSVRTVTSVVPRRNARAK